jgi:rubrerythrin
MLQPITDIGKQLSYFRLLDASEQGRWNFAELPWDSLDRDKVTPELLQNVKAFAFGELTTFSATESFMKLFYDDVDFSQWLAVWFYEETKHPMALIRWLSLQGVSTDEAFIYKGREITPMTNSKVEMLTFNIISEINAASMYNFLREATDEPLLQEITRNLGRDEMRHSVGFTEYCRRIIERSDDPDSERVRVLRTAWYMLQPVTRDELTRHPVLLTRNSTHGVNWDEISQKTNELVLNRISKLVDIDIAGFDALYEVYADLKKKSRPRRVAAPANDARATA